MKISGPTKKIRKMIDPGRFHICSATLSERAGRWFVSLTGVAAEFHRAERSRSNRLAIPIGVDRGIISLAVAADANGDHFETFEGVTTMREALSKLKAANQALSRTKAGSKGRQRARLRLAKLHLKVANTRRHLAHEASATLVAKSQILVLEDLNISGMVRNRHLARSVMDSAMRELDRQIRYKGSWYGVEVRHADRFFPSSKICSGCGEINRQLMLSQRTFNCPLCGLSIDRDLNAAIDLARWQPRTPAPQLSVREERNASSSI
jgi:putative transposase